MYTIMNDNTQEQRLVERAQNGDHKALEELYLGARDRLLATIRKRIGSATRQVVDPEDVLQASFVRALHSVQRFEWQGEGSFHRWLVSIATHVTLDMVRHQGRRTMLRIDRDIKDDGTSPSKGIRRQERLERLEQAMETLSPDYRTVLKLSRMDGLSIKEIAEQMDRSQSAIKNLLLRATRQLRLSFGDTVSLNLGERHFDDKGAADDC